MTNFARIINRVAVDVSTDPASCFVAELVPEFEPVPDEVCPQWRLVDSEWQPPIFYPPPEPSLAEIEAQIAALQAQAAALRGE